MGQSSNNRSERVKAGYARQERELIDRANRAREITPEMERIAKRARMEEQRLFAEAERAAAALRAARSLPAHKAGDSTKGLEAPKKAC